MEFIRNKLIDVYTKYQRHNKQLLQYSSSDQFQDNANEDFIGNLKEKINETIMDIIVFIAKSCKKQNNSISKEVIVLTVPEMTVLCKAKENLQKIRYNLLNLSGNSYLDSQRLLRQILLLCSDSSVFREEIKNINQEVEQFDNLANFTHRKQRITTLEENPQKKQGISVSEIRLNAQYKSENSKKENFYEYRLNQTYQNTPQARIRKIDISYLDQINSKDRHEAQKIKKTRKKKYNYIHNFQAEQQNMRQMSKYVIGKFSL